MRTDTRKRNAAITALFQVEVEKVAGRIPPAGRNELDHFSEVDSNSLSNSLRVWIYSMPMEVVNMKYACLLGIAAIVGLSPESGVTYENGTGGFRTS